MTKKVAAINDLSGFGKCSLTIALPILSVLGIQACPLPTAILTNQTGFSSYYIDDYTEKIANFTEQWQKLNYDFDAIYTGFLANEVQVDKILNFIDIFQKKNTLLLVDPVMGDNGKIYSTYTNGLCRKMSHLVSRANVITPNLTEACILTGIDYFEFISHRGQPDYLDRVRDMGLKLIEIGPETVVITGIKYKAPHDRHEYLYNAAICSGQTFYSKSEIYGIGYSGTGDIFASIICGYLVQNRSVKEASEKAAGFIEAAVKDAYSEGIDRNYGVSFEKYLYMLLEDTVYEKE